MVTQYKVFEDKKDWLEARTKVITSTEVASLFSCERPGDYGKSIYDLWHDKKNKVVEMSSGDSSARKGLFFEPAIANWFASIHNLSISEKNHFAYDEELRQGSSFDYQVDAGEIDGQDVSGAIMEIKTATYHVHREKWLDDMPPAYIEFQCQMQMKITGIDTCVLVLFVDGDFAPKHWIIKACADIHNAIDAATKDFWQSIDDNREPEPDFEKDYKSVIKHYSESSEDEEEASDEVVYLISDYVKQRSIEKSAAVTAQQIKAKIFKSTAAEKVYTEDFVVTMKTNKKGVRSLIVK